MTVHDEPSPAWRRIGQELAVWLKTLTSAAVYATLIVTFGFQVARVDGRSMQPTLQDNDRLIVNKLAYQLGDPNIGDVVMLYSPLDPEKALVKRVIGQPGDRIRIVGGRVFRNDVPVDDSFVAQEYRSHEDWGPEMVPEGYYFVMGDHRNNSLDSRHWGFVPKKYIAGKVQVRWWPMSHGHVF
jgi:signal peptidase I